MKRQRFRFKVLALILFGLFALLAVYGGYSVVTNGSRWFASSHNSRLRSQKQQVTAGDILDRDGVVLAHTEDGNRLYHEDAETRRAVVHVVGGTDGRVRNGVESFQASYLYGFQSSVPDRITDLISGTPRKGDTVRLTVSSSLCKALAAAMARSGTGTSTRGAAVVMNWKTGEILAMVSLPAFDPNAPGTSEKDESCLNRVTEGLYQPGSLVEVITGAAAAAAAPSLLRADFDCSPSVHYQGDEAVGEADAGTHGVVNMAGAFAAGCDRMFASAALTVGGSALRRTAEQFGCGDNFLFGELVIENTLYPSTEGTAALAARGIGRGEGMLFTPIHLCMITAGIANGGAMMEPKVLARVISSSDKTRLSLNPSVYRTCADAQTAGLLKDWMRGAAAEGAAGLAGVDGLTLCSKCGHGDNSAIYTGFIEDSGMPWAMTVLIEGGTEEAAARAAAEGWAWIRDNFGRNESAPADTSEE